MRIMTLMQLRKQPSPDSSEGQGPVFYLDSNVAVIGKNLAVGRAVHAIEKGAEASVVTYLYDSSKKWRYSLLGLGILFTAVFLVAAAFSLGLLTASLSGGGAAVSMLGFAWVELLPQLRGLRTGYMVRIERAGLHGRTVVLRTVDEYRACLIAEAVTHAAEYAPVQA